MVKFGAMALITEAQLNMANLNEEPVWEAGIYQFETTDPVEGGPEGIDNKPTRQLANRTAYLKQEQEKLKDKFNEEKTPNPLPQYLLASVAQFLPYNPVRIYSVGEVCYTKDAESGELSYWQWYSNVESLAGKTPLDTANRHIGWQDNTKPFYWIPYTGDQVGMPFYWLDTSAPEWAVMEINVNLPIAVYWRLARRYPQLVRDDYINTGEIRGEFLRVLDQGRGVDAGRSIQSYQDDELERHTHTFSAPFSITANTGSTGIIISASHVPNWNTTYTGGNETRPRNIARSMAIVI